MDCFCQVTAKKLIYHLGMINHPCRISSTWLPTKNKDLTVNQEKNDDFTSGNVLGNGVHVNIKCAFRFSHIIKFWIYHGEQQFIGWWFQDITKLVKP